MATRSARSSGSEEVFLLDSEKLRVDSGAPSDRGIENELLRASIWKTAKSYRLDFAEINPSVRLENQDLSSNQSDLNLFVKTSEKKRITHFSAEQKALLEAMFHRNKYPSGDEIATLATQLDVGISRVQKWFNNRRQRWRIEKTKYGLNASKVCRAIFPGCCFDCSTQSFPVSCQDEPLPVLRPLFVTGLSSSLQFTEHFIAGSNTQQKQQQPSPVPRPIFVADTGTLPSQRVYSPLPAQRNIPPPCAPEEKPRVKRFVQRVAVPSNPGCCSPQPDATDFSGLIDQFPFVFSFAEDLPNIFGNQEFNDASVACI